MLSVSIGITYLKKFLVAFGFSPASNFTGGQPGLWVDPSDLTDEKLTHRRNLLTYSEQFDNAAWTKGPGTVVTANTTVAPDGSTTADTVSSSGNFLLQLANFAAAAGARATFSVYIKSNVATTVTATYNGATSTPNNSLGTEVFAVTTAWQRFTYSAVIAANDTGLYILLYGMASQDYQIWGAQLETNTVTPTVYQKITDYSTEFLQAFPTTALFQDSTGTSPVTAVTQPVGLMLDKRLAVINYDPATMATQSYDANGAVTIARDGANLTFTNAGNGDGIRFSAVGPLDALAEIEFTASGTGSLFIFAGGSPAVFTLSATPTRFRAVTHPNGSSFTIFRAYSAATSAAITITAVRARRGNHLSQATASARPTQSARVNLLQGTESMASPPWGTGASASLTGGGASSPSGTSTVTRLLENTSAGLHYVVDTGSKPLAAIVYRLSVHVRAVTNNRRVALIMAGATQGAQFDLETMSVTFAGTDIVPGSATVTSLPGSWVRLSADFIIPTAGNYTIIAALSNKNVATSYDSYTGDGTSGIDIWGIDLRPAAGTFPAYQRVNTATDYDAVGFPQFLNFDGLDDGIATGAMTFSTNMDCFFAVRRATAANLLVAAPTGNSGSFFGVAQSGSASVADADSGTPTYTVNGVDVNGGAVGTTRGQLHTALTVSTWVVLEVRNLNLSAVAWTALVLGNYNGFQLNGDLGGIILCPAGDAAARQKNRQYLGAKVGLALP